MAKKKAKRRSKVNQLEELRDMILQTTYGVRADYDWPGALSEAILRWAKKYEEEPRG